MNYQDKLKFYFNGKNYIKTPPKWEIDDVLPKINDPSPKGLSYIRYRGQLILNAYLQDAGLDKKEMRKYKLPDCYPCLHFSDDSAAQKMDRFDKEIKHLPSTIFEIRKEIKEVLQY